MFKFGLPFTKKRSSKKDFIAAGSLPTVKTEKAGFSRKNRQVVRVEKKSNRFRNLIIILSIILLLGLIVAIFKSPFFLIKNITVDAPDITCASSEQIKQSSGLEGQNLLLINPLDVSENVKRFIFCANLVKVSKKFPDQALLKITPRIAVAQVTVYNSPLVDDLKTLEASPSSAPAQLIREYTPGNKIGTFKVDKDGLLFEIAGDNLAVPKFSLSQSGLSLGKPIDPKIIALNGQISDELKVLGIEYQDIKFEQGNIYITADPKITISMDQDIAKELVILQLILQKSKIDAVPLESVDLRFEKPVVKYAGQVKN